MPLEVKTMTVDEWIAVKDHPLQRDTEKRAKNAARGHLKKLEEVHRAVHAARYKGCLYKLDGHTRARLWNSGKLARPKDLTVTIYRPADETKFNLLYDMFDNRVATKTPSDDLFGACNALGIRFESSLLRVHKFSTQLRRAEDRHNGGGVHILDLVRKWSEELMIVDSAGLSRRNPFVVGTMLRLIRDNPALHAKIVEFFRRVDADKGIKDNSRGRDGVQMLVEFIAERRASGGASGWEGWDAIDKEIHRSFHQWIAGRFNTTNRSQSKPRNKDARKRVSL